MFTRFVITVAAVSAALLAIGTVAQVSALVVAGLAFLSMDAILVAIRTDDTTQPMAHLLFEDA